LPGVREEIVHGLFTVPFGSAATADRQKHRTMPRLLELKKRNDKLWAAAIIRLT
jgi:hypothetical protein